MSEIQNTTQMISNGWFYDATHNCWALPEDKHLEALRVCKNRALAEAAVRINAEHSTGFAAGLDAAREAVADALDAWGADPLDALTAIDALHTSSSRPAPTGQRDDGPSVAPAGEGTTGHPIDALRGAE